MHSKKDTVPAHKSYEYLLAYVFCGAQNRKIHKLIIDENESQMRRRWKESRDTMNKNSHPASGCKCFELTEFKPASSTFTVLECRIDPMNY
jgi:hypothetical protein